MFSAPHIRDESYVLNFFSNHFSFVANGLIAVNSEASLGSPLQLLFSFLNERGLAFSFGFLITPFKPNE